MSWKPITSWTPNCHSKRGTSAGVWRAAVEEGDNLHDNVEYCIYIALVDVTPVLHYQCISLISNKPFSEWSGSHPVAVLHGACTTECCSFTCKGWQQHSPIHPWHYVSVCPAAQYPIMTSCRGQAVVLQWPECIYNLFIVKLRQKL